MIVEIPDHNVEIEFPDDMDRAEIARILSEKYPHNPQTRSNSGSTAQAPESDSAPLLGQGEGVDKGQNDEEEDYEEAA